MSPSGFNLTADDYDISEVLEGSDQLEVPDYQREYSWRKDQWSELWDDVYALTRERDNHFIGSIVVIKKRGGDIKKLELVDGQQRLTTISVILCAIRDKFKDEEEFDEIADLVDGFLRIQSRTTGEYHQKIKLNKFHNEDFKKLLDAKATQMHKSEIKDAYDFYHEKLDSLSAEKIQRIYDELIHSISLVQIECGSEVSAFRLFESLNDKGLDLGAVDLVKNRLFMEAHENPQIDEEIVKELWEDIMSKIRPELDQNYRFFCHYFMSIPKPDIRDDVSKRNLYDYVDELLNGKLAEVDISVEDLLEDMVNKSALYVDILNCTVSDGFKPSRLTELNTKLEATQIKDNRVRTLLLKIIDGYTNADDVIEALNILEVLNVRSKIEGRGSNTTRDRFWSRICSMMDNYDEPNRYLRRVTEQRSPSDTILLERIPDIEFKNNDFTKYILNRIEEKHYMRSGGRGKAVSDRSTVDIEHIAPQRVWSANKYSTWKQYLNCSEEEFEEYKRRIGNLTLLEDRANQAATDSPFEQKCNIYQNDTDFLMTQEIAEEYDEWRIEQIQERSEKMANIICEVWNMNDV